MRGVEWVYRQSKQGNIMEYAHFASQHGYARRNGYKGSYDEYVKIQYEAYKTICKRCDARPMTFQQWKDSK
jgi:hypothetical protein